MAAKKTKVAPGAANNRAATKATKKATKKTATRRSSRSPKKSVHVVDSEPLRRKPLRAAKAAKKKVSRTLETGMTKARTSVQHAVRAVKKAAPKRLSAAFENLVAKARSLGA